MLVGWGPWRRGLILGVVLCPVLACSEPSTAANTPDRASRHPSTASLLVTVSGAQPSTVIPSNFLGLSFETTVLRSRSITSRTPRLVRLLSGLGTGVMRISGDSVDRTQWLPSPVKPATWATATVAPTDLENLAALMRATGWQLILGLNLGHPDPPSVVNEARSASLILGSSLAGLAIGNEPDLYTRAVPVPFRALLGSKALRQSKWGYDEYRSEIAQMRAALTAAGVSASQYGPETATVGWLGRYAADQRGGLAALTPHFYPLDRCYGGRLLRKGPSIVSLLSHDVAKRELLRIKHLVRTAASNGLPLRIDETNSVACAGAPNTSDTFAAALWALDFSLMAAREGASGLNFHGGLGSCQNGGTVISPWYSPLCTLPNGQLTARPEYYALLLVHSLEGYAFVPASYRTSRNVSIYALRGTNGTLRLVVDDMEMRSTSRAHPHPPLWVTIHVPRSYRRGSIVRLSAPDVTAKRGVTLGGASLGPDGSPPAPASQPLAGGSGRFVLRVKAGSAALLTLTP